jgi:cholesterol transport system auxiliary component
MTKQHLIIVLISALLAGCITVGLGGGSGASLTTYTLGAPRAAPQPMAPVNWQLVVDKPSAAKALATNRIVVMPRPGVIAVYEGAQWADRAPEMLQSLLIQALEASGSITAVDRPVSGLRGDYTLVSEVRAFQAEYDDGGAPTVHVSLSLRLLQPARNRILAAHRVEARQRAAATDIASVVQAFDVATAEVVAAAVVWTLESGEANRHSGPPEAFR